MAIMSKEIISTKDKQEKLAEALRQNLMKRKQQARARTQPNNEQKKQSEKE